MNLTGLEQFHQGKSDDETHRSPLEASQSQVHRSEGSADDRRAQARPEIVLRAAAASTGSGIGLTGIASSSYVRAMITKISGLIAVIGFACICISQAQSPTPAESPAKHRVAKKAHATPSPTGVAASASPAASPAASPKAKRGSKKEATAAAHVTPSPSPGKFNLGDLFKPKTSRQQVQRPRHAAPSKGTSTQAATKPPAPGGGHGLVWVNTETHVYHKEGSRFYGTTKKGKYTTEAEAIKEGDKAGGERH